MTQVASGAGDHVMGHTKVYNTKVVEEGRSLIRLYEDLICIQPLEASLGYINSIICPWPGLNLHVNPHEQPALYLPISLNGACAFHSFLQLSSGLALDMLNLDLVVSVGLSRGDSGLGSHQHTAFGIPPLPVIIAHLGLDACDAASRPPEKRQLFMSIS